MRKIEALDGVVAVIIGAMRATPDIGIHVQENPCPRKAFLWHRNGWISQGHCSGMMDDYLTRTTRTRRSNIICASVPLG